MVKEPNSRRGVLDARPTIRTGGGRFWRPIQVRRGVQTACPTVGAGGVHKTKPVPSRAGGSDELVQRSAQEALEIWSKTKSRAGGSQKVRPTLAQPPFAYLARQSTYLFPPLRRGRWIHKSECLAIASLSLCRIVVFVYKNATCILNGTEISPRSTFRGSAGTCPHAPRACAALVLRFFMYHDN